MGKEEVKFRVRKPEGIARNCLKCKLDPGVFLLCFTVQQHLNKHELHGRLTRKKTISGSILKKIQETS